MSNISVVEEIPVKNECMGCPDCNEENGYIQSIKKELRKLREIFGDQRKHRQPESVWPMQKWQKEGRFTTPVPDDPENM